MTYGCDTSFLMRILTNEPKPLSVEVISRAYMMIKAGDRFEISDLVLSEAYFALQASYGVAKADALRVLKAISCAQGFIVSPHAKEILAQPGLEKFSPGFVDRLIHGGYYANGHKTAACEKSFRKLSQTEIFG